MIYKTLSGKEPAAEILKQIKNQVKGMDAAPRLGIIVVGEHEPTEIYINRKKTVASEVGVETEIYRLPSNIKQDELIMLIEELNKNSKINGFIIQTPLPPQIDPKAIFEKISPFKDVDGFHPSNMGKILLNIFDNKMFSPATPSGILKLLQYYEVPIAGSEVVVIGRSNIVGKPISIMLLHNDATVTICHSQTKNLTEHTKRADILVVAAGIPGLINSAAVKEGAYVIDVGTTRIKDNEGKMRLVGDVDFKDVINKAHCSPVPGGVGQLTVAMLIANTVKAALRKRDQP